MKNQVVFGDVRISFLGEDVVRVEQKYKGAFLDEGTYFIPDRKKFKGGPAYTLNEGVLCFGDYALYLPESGLKGLRLEKKGKRVYTYKRLKNSGELPAPYKTPEVFALADNPRILIPEGGYSVNRKGEYAIQEEVEDIYLLFANKDAKKLRRLYVELTGRSELVRLSTLGSWNSKYYAYNEAEAKQVILDYERLGVPLDNLVIDTDWRSSEMGWGYEINEALFPDMKRFLDFAHSHKIDVMFNDHPEPAEGAHVFAPQEIAYRERNLQALLKLGVDTWWYDRNWHTHLISPVEEVKWESFGLYLYRDITKNFYEEQAQSEIHRRPVVMGNVVNIANGDYRGISDSASHRYGIQWTGDIASDFCALAQEVKNLVRCADNCLPYMNSDCGGHTGNPDKEQFIRWMQYGTLSPVFRPHCTKGLLRSREPWLYDEETLNIVRQYNLLRYRLLPYLYTNAYEAYQTGIGTVRSLALEYPKDKCAIRYDEYLLGKDLLVAPVLGAVGDEREIYLPAGKWMDVFDGEIYAGRHTIKKRFSLSQMPLFVRLGSVLPLAFSAQTTKEQSFENLVYDFYPDKKGGECGYLYEDDGETTAYQKGAFSISNYVARYLQKENAFVVTLKKGEGAFEGDRFVSVRRAKLKYHVLQGADVKRVSINGQEVPFERAAKENVFPLNTGNAAPDGETVTVDFNMERDKDYQIKFYLK